MKTILVLGAGRSSSSLISYLLTHARTHDWQVIVGDASPALALQKINGHERGKAVVFDINDPDKSVDILKQADVVVSLLPANLHPLVAVRCLEYEKHLLTASYVSDEMKILHDEAEAKGLLFMNECGLDPGIDHMSAMQVIDRIRDNGGVLTSFESFTGGLIAPDTDPENPWRYKFTWNPRNVVMAGQATAKFLQEGKYKYIPYQQLFRRTTSIHVPGHGDYEGYANRDSLQYINTYQLHGVKTMLRGTLRNKGFCEAWNIFVQLGCCEDNYEMEGVDVMTHVDFINSFLPEHPNKSVIEKLSTQCGLSPDSVSLHYLTWSGFFDNTPVGLQRGTPAQILEHILNKKWKLKPEDKDQIVMWHRFVYFENGKQKELQSSLIATGTDSIYTAMAKTVGLPLGIATKMLLSGSISKRGVVIPIHREIYEPILGDLKALGIELHERVIA